jgi:hypothetical protein
VTEGRSSVKTLLLGHGLFLNFQHVAFVRVITLVNGRKLPTQLLTAVGFDLKLSIGY